MIEAVDFASEAPALWDESEGEVVSYRELGRRVAAVETWLTQQPKPCLAFAFLPNSSGWVTAYLACLAGGVALGLGEPAEASRARIVGTYRPSLLFLPVDATNVPSGYSRVTDLQIAGVDIWRNDSGAGYPEAIASELALLLATSGSTGDAKFVRLSRRNLLANARSIAAYLRIDRKERALQSLPLHYSYGLSVLNSHLVSGGSIALTKHSFMRPEFWKVAKDRECTSFAGVPYMYETLSRLRLMPTTVAPTLTTLTQAGGHLKPELAKQFLDAAEAREARFVVMYGQTEATARMAYLPPERLREKLGSIGIAIPEGKLWLEPVAEDARLRQLFYSGPNVMLGYAHGPADLGRGDEQSGVLATGDLAECDADGFFRVTGRLARFAKLFGKRVNLADVEAESEKFTRCRVGTVDGGDHLRVFVESAEPTEADRLRPHLAEWLSVPPIAIKVKVLGQLPLTPSGKKDYKALQ